MPKIRKSAKLSKTSAIKDRAIEAEELEKKKLGIKREMEKIMAEYARITGFSKLKARKHRVGERLTIGSARNTVSAVKDNRYLKI